MEIVNLIIQSFFTGFAWSMIFSCLLSIYRNERIQKQNKNFSNSAVFIIRYVAIIWFILMIIYLISAYTSSSQQLIDTLSNRMFGKYAYAFWSIIIVFFVLPQLLWIRKINQSIIAKALVAAFLLVAVYFERVVIIMTSLHRDFGQGNWLPACGNLLLDALSITAVFVFLTFLAASIRMQKTTSANKIIDGEE